MIAFRLTGHHWTRKNTSGTEALVTNEGDTVCFQSLTTTRKGKRRVTAVIGIDRRELSNVLAAIEAAPHETRALPVVAFPGA
jgi:hypothetical protein